MLLSPERGATLMLINQGAAAGGGAVRIGATPWLDFDAATALADPARDLATPLKGPFRAIPRADAADAALKLARLAGLLPAFFVCDGAAGGDAPVLPAVAIADYDSPSHLCIASRAHLPLTAVDIVERVPHRAGANPHNVAYLATKRDRTGHML